jgi:uncharacterized protein YbaP (TraB family)
MNRNITLVNRLALKFFAFIIVVNTGCVGGQPKGFETSDKFSLLWEITGNGLQKPSYLFGTLHIYDSSVFRIPKEVYAAIDLCDNFALEIDVSTIDQGMLLQSVMINDPDSALDRLLEPEIYAEMQNVPLIKMMGDAVNMMKPFYIQQYILIENPLTIQSIEMNLNSHAKDGEKNIFGIEKIEEQLAVINAIPLSEQAQTIKDIYNYCKRENISFVEAGKRMFAKIQITYKEQDFENLIRLDDEFKMTSGSPDFDSTVIGERNVAMADRIDAFVRQGKTLFVAIGALHLPDYREMSGVVALLKEKKYNLRPLLIDLNN